MALVMPGTTSNGDAGGGAAPRPPRRRGRTRTGRRPSAARRLGRCAPWSTSSCVDLLLGEVDVARAPCPPSISSAPRRRELEQRRRREPVVHHDVGAREQLGAAHGEQPGIARARAHEVHGHARRSVVEQRAAAVRRAARGRGRAPTSTGIGAATRVAQHDVAVERREQRLDRDLVAVVDACASAPHGRSQPPPSSARNARSASTARCARGVVDRGEPRAACRRRRRGTRPRARPARPAGSITDGSSTSVGVGRRARAARARRPRPRPRRSRRALARAGSRCCRAARRT